MVILMDAQGARLRLTAAEGRHCGVWQRDMGKGVVARVVPPLQEVWHSNHVQSDLNNQSNQ